MAQARRVLEQVAQSLSVGFDLCEIPCGGRYFLEHGRDWPEGSEERCRQADVLLLGAVGWPSPTRDGPVMMGDGKMAGWSPVIGNRSKLDLYANLRPVKLYDGVRARICGEHKQVWKPEQVDMLFVRENTEDLYAGVEFEPGTPEAKQIIALAGGRIRDDAAISIKPISAFASERIVDFAFRYAVENGRRKVTAVAKDNIMKATDGLFSRSAREVAKRYEGKVEYDEWLVDAMCMQLVQKPELYDVLVMPNLYGDILSDLCAGLVGGLGVAPGANIGDGGAVFEATHGSAPKYKGRNKVNPTAMILSGKLMLDHLGESAAGQRLEAAVAKVIAEGKYVTYDMKPNRDDPTAVGTSQMADAIIAAL